MPKITQLAGILCVGQNHNQAVENFRRTATGQNLMIYGSAEGVGFASQSGADLYNPNGGEELLVEHPDLVEKAEVQSQSSAGDVKAHYTICLDGCGSHVISDSAALVQGCCPSCSADLSEITDERVTQFLAESASADEQIEHAGLVATGETAEAAQRNFALALSNAHAFTALSGTGSFNAATTVNFDPYTGQAVENCEAQEAPEAITALSSNAANGEVEAHIYSCSANCEQPFTVSSDEEPVFCAHCSAALVDEPIASQSGDDDSDIDIIEEEDLEDEDDSSDDEDEDFDSESSNDDEDDIDDEDDLDDEDLDEDDLDDIDDEDLEDDEDLDDLEEEDEDEDFDSESSSDDDLEDEDDIDEDEDLDDEDLDDEEELEEDDLDVDDEDDFDSESKSVSRVFNSLSTAQAQHGTLDPQLVSLSRAVGKLDTVHMYYDGQPIARATFASVSGAVGEENAAKSFASDNFIRAVSHSLNSAGVTGTCEAFGFMPYQIEMPVDALLVAESDARISEATANVTGTIEEATSAYTDRFVAALSASQLGVTKNFWGDVRNPIVESLVSSLSAAGIKEPRAVVERAFIAHGKDFLTTALSKAMDLMNKSEVAQNEISESIDAAAGTVTAERAPVVQQQVVAAQPKAPVNAAELLTQSDVPVQSQSSASTGSFEDKLSRLRRM
ncbi:hypothetical protein pEaSNUABM30_00138 [Erwinia phage pEa_SNUABM_30]|uniref:Uncharacterized protein n=1 Tax=Erwinia phage pEa_SNUABM_30 TaxID=2869553 RepID=A0AAE8XMP0_9CAUD|nr:ATPase [Erwinia phage pEa_SNUABM_30]UAW53256.1 hypothetical protein pEaSNUABM30_00138 [Erwinia phage pEa_SNUABM_30]